MRDFGDEWDGLIEYEVDITVNGHGEIVSRDEHWDWNDEIKLNENALDLLMITVMIDAPIIEAIDEIGEMKKLD